MAYSVKDVANKIIATSANTQAGELISNLKLQKLLYYTQGFHLAYFGTPLFEEEIEAWMYGPVVPCIYEKYKGYGSSGISADNNNVIVFTGKNEESLFREVLDTYGQYSATGLMNMTHNEAPWRSVPTGQGHIIPKDSLKEFFKTRIE